MVLKCIICISELSIMDDREWWAARSDDGFIQDLSVKRMYAVLE